MSDHNHTSVICVADATPCEDAPSEENDAGVTYKGVASENILYIVIYDQGRKIVWRIAYMTLCSIFVNLQTYAYQFA